jgi:hypothetical protein
MEDKRDPNLENDEFGNTNEEGIVDSADDEFEDDSDDDDSDDSDSADADESN